MSDRINKEGKLNKKIRTAGQFRTWDFSKEKKNWDGGMIYLYHAAIPVFFFLTKVPRSKLPSGSYFFI
jgi:hypothetical protein